MQYAFLASHGDIAYTLRAMFDSSEFGDDCLAGSSKTRCSMSFGAAAGL
jgi:hypothetical protein